MLQAAPVSLFLIMESDVSIHTIINHSPLVSWWELFNALQYLYLLMNGIFFPGFFDKY